MGFVESFDLRGLRLMGIVSLDFGGGVVGGKWEEMLTDGAYDWHGWHGWHGWYG